MKIQLYNLKICLAELELDRKKIQTMLCELEQLNFEIRKLISIDGVPFQINKQIEELRYREQTLTKYIEALTTIIKTYESTEQKIVLNSLVEVGRANPFLHLNLRSTRYVENLISGLRIM